MLSTSITSEAKLRFEKRDAPLRTVMSRRLVGGLSHLSKPYWNGDTLAVQLVNPTAGLFGGDSLSIELVVADGARVAITSPSVTRFHTMKADEIALMDQDISVGQGALLDFWPEWVMAQKDARVRQHNRIQLAADACMVFYDGFAPGREAHGELNDYALYHNELDIYVEGKLLARERTRLEPVDRKLPVLMPSWDACYLASVWCYSGDQANDDVAELASVLALIEDDENHMVSFTKLGDGLSVFRLMAANAVSLRRISELIRAEIIQRHTKHKVNFRKL